MSETAYFGAGCFWGAELALSQIPGIIATEVGFSNIKTSKGKESKVETVKLEFDPSLISFSKLIETFWDIHNPGDKQNKSETYVEKSVIFGLDENQIEQAKISLEYQKKRKINNEIFTIVHPFITYSKAPEKDQQYYSKNK
ncbi:MAG: Peptide methionine sulfoxide reductase MsrA [Candidatus Heimdallarchaeota archaeon LC_2]|nr:MAG: Peptide methionine sulfoxide reductase MsrA [Candidatus Heimdallarchaeota archaeon LC_2]